MKEGKKHYIKTPLFRSHSLSNKYGIHVSYKMDCYQPTGSFKIRGMDVLLQQLSNEGHKQVIASSGGNAGYSVAYIAKQLGMTTRLIVPETTSAYMIDKIRLLDAEIEVYGKNWDETNTYAKAKALKFGLPYVHPFDHPLLWKGHSSIIDECASTMAEPDKIVVAVGGGGLLCGIFEGMLRNQWSKAEVITAETEGAASFAKSLENGQLVELDKINTIATSLGAKKITQQALDYASKFKVKTHVTNDKTALQACSHFFEEYHVMVEPACGAALSYIKANSDTFQPNEKILVIVCGGVNMGMTKFLEYAKTYNLE